MERRTDIEEVNSFSDLLEINIKKYNNLILFKTYDKEWTYQQFYVDVMKIADYINGISQQYIRIDIGYAYYFAISFYASVMMGKTAVLCDAKEYENADSVFVMSEDEVLSIISNEEKPERFFSQSDNNAPCVIVRSSGTTSVSKGVMLSQNNLITELKMLIPFKPFPEKQVYFHILPYYHLFGLLGEFLIPLCTGSTVCFSSNNLELFKNLSVFKPTFMHAPPAIIESIVRILVHTDNFVAATGGRLKTIISGGAYLNDKNREILNNYGVNVYVAYGLTECSPVISVERDGMERTGSVGQILPGCDVKIVDDEIVVSADTVMLGYWNDEESTKKVIHDGYLYTGDMGYIDDEGYLFLKGRISNLIVFENGQKIIPENIEKCLDKITNVEESLVTSVKKNTKTKINIYACVNNNIDNTVKDSIDREIKDILKDFVDVGFLNEIIYQAAPLKRNHMGKIDRNYYR